MADRPNAPWWVNAFFVDMTASNFELEIDIRGEPRVATIDIEYKWLGTRYSETQVTVIKESSSGYWRFMDTDRFTPKAVVENLERAAKYRIKVEQRRAEASSTVDATHYPFSECATCSLNKNNTGETIE